MTKQTPKTLIDIIKISAKEYSSYPALSMVINYRTHTLTYGELYARSQQTANWLAENGVGEGDAVLMNAPSSPNAVVLLFGVFLRGAVFVPLNTQSTPEMVKGIAQSCNAKLLFSHTRGYADPELSVTTQNLDYLLDLIDGFDANYNHEHELDVSPDTLAQIMYTSGTTGSPKGVMLTHRNMLTSTMSVARNAHMSKNDNLLSILPLSHIYEQVAGLFAPLVSGSHIVYLHRPSALVSLLKEHRITKMAGVPEFLRILMNKIELAAERNNQGDVLARLMRFNNKVPSMFLRRLIARKVHKQLGGRLRMVASGGSPLDAELEEKWNSLGIQLLQGYGLTEVAGVATMNTLSAHKEHSVGKPIDSMQITIADDGEICMTGPSVFNGYYQREDATEAVLKNNLFHTGDIGEIDKDGFLYIKGRKKYMLKGAGGQNVYPEDIEAKLDAEPGIADSCAVAIENDGHMFIVAVVRTEDSEVDLDKVRESANSQLASYQKVNQLLVWPEFDFPRSASKKIKRDPVQKWADKALEGGSADTGVAKGSKLSQLLASVTGVGIEKVKPDAILATDLALDSLMRVELVARIELEFGVLIEETKITAETTVSDLEEIIEETEPSTANEPFIRWPLSWWAQSLRAYFIGPILNFLTAVVFRVRTHNVEALSHLKGPLLIMPNHKAAIDSVAVARSVPSHIRRKLSHAAGADSPLFLDYTKLVQLIRLWLHPFPLPTQTNARFEDGLSYVGWMLDNGYSVCIFPEGETKPNNNILPVKDGVAFMASHMDVPVIPVFLSGIEHIMKPRGVAIDSWFKTVDVWYGEPLYFKSEETLEDVRLRITLALGELRDKAESQQ